MTPPPLSPPVVVVGGGPAGLTAALAAAEAGARVLVLEKNQSLGRKLLLSGNGRCNLTNEEPDAFALADRYGRQGRALVGPFQAFGPAAVREWFAARGLQTKVEDRGRVFPVTDKAQSVLDALTRDFRRLGVSVRYGAVVRGLYESPEVETARRRLGGVILPSGPLAARAVILAAGGSSHPETGSTGDAWRWLESLGEPVRRPESSLVPVKTKEGWVRDLQGLAFADLKITPRLDGQPLKPVRGRVLFTHFGLSGPLVLAQSAAWRDLAKTGRLTWSLDWFAGEDEGALDRRIQELLKARPRAGLASALDSLAPGRLVEFWLTRAGQALKSPAAAWSREGRRAFVQAAKGLTLTWAGLMDPSWAVSASGGLDPGAVDFRTLRLKAWDNLYAVGDVLDFDRPSGGFSLQVCWSTGLLAGRASAG